MPDIRKLTLLILLPFVSRSQGIVVLSDVLCTEIPVTFSASIAGAESYKWRIAPSGNFSEQNGSSVSYTFPNAGTYTVTLSSDVGPTKVTVNRSIRVSKKASASFNASLNKNGYPAELTLTNYSKSSVKTCWKFSDAPDDSTNSTVKQYHAAGHYTVTLIAIGNKGCNDTSAYAFIISDSASLRLPNVFSPNGDEINDLYKPLSSGISTLQARVYSRAGALVYEWIGPEGFWDGRTNSGEICSDGEYIILVEAVGFDGRSFNLKSNITLVR